MLEIGFEIVELEKVRQNSWNLVGGVYREVARNSKYKIVTINQFFDQELITLKKGKTITKAKIEKGNIPVIAGGRTSPYTHSKYTNEGNVITISASGAHAGYIWYHDCQIWASDCNVLYSNNETIVLTKYLYYVLHAQQQEIYKLQHGAGQPHIYGNDLKNIKIPLPSIEQQQQIVDELDSYQKIIDGANQVVDNWKLDVESVFEVINLNKCELKKFDDVIELLRGPFGSSIKKEVCVKSGFKVYEQGNVIKNNFIIGEYYVDEQRFEALKKFEIQENDVLITCAGTLGRVAIVPKEVERGIINSVLMRLRIRSNDLLPQYLKFFLKSDIMQNELINNCLGTSIKNMKAGKEIKSLLIPLLPIGEQQKIVEQLDNEHKMIESQKEIISYFEAKVHDKLNSIWEQDETTK